MNILYVTMQFPSPSETFACTDVRNMVKIGENVSVHSLKFKHNMNSALISERSLHDIEITHNSVMATLTGIALGLFSPRILVKIMFLIVKYNFKRLNELIKSIILVPRALHIYYLIKKIKPDIVHLFWGHYPSIVGMLVKKELPDVILSVFLGAYDLEQRYGLSRPTSKMADAVLTHSQFNVKEIQALSIPKSKIFVVHRGIEISNLKNMTDQHSKINKKIVSVSRLINSKGVDDLIKSFAQISEHHPDAFLTIIGGGPEYKNLHRLCLKLHITHAVKFTGHISHDKVIKEMNDADIFLFMSRKESERLPNAVKEAMAARCFCVVTDTPGIQELVEDRVHGFVIPQGDIDAAVEKVLSIFSNREKYMYMLDNSNNKIKECFDVEKQISRYINIWSNINVSKE